MKLLFCPHCNDIQKLTRKEVRRCKCGKAYGRGLPDGSHVWVNEGTLVIGIANDDLLYAAGQRLAGGDAEIFITCWLFEKGYSKISLVDNPPELPGRMIEVEESQP